MFSYTVMTFIIGGHGVGCINMQHDIKGNFSSTLKLLKVKIIKTGRHSAFLFTTAYESLIMRLYSCLEVVLENVLCTPHYKIVTYYPVLT